MVGYAVQVELMHAKHKMYMQVVANARDLHHAFHPTSGQLSAAH